MRYYSNTAVATTLENSGGVTPTTTQLILGSTTGYPTQFPFTLRLDPDTPNEEIVTVNSGGGSVSNPYVVSRGSDGTSAKTHAQYSVVTHGFSARDLKEPQDHIADTTIHVRRPLYTFQTTAEPPFNVGGVWTAFTSSTWSGITFTAPPSGIVTISMSAYMYNKNTGGSIVAVSFRMAGGKTVVPGLDNGLGVDVQSLLSATKQTIVTGLTPGVSTTITPQWYISSGTPDTAHIGGGQMWVELHP